MLIDLLPLLIGVALFVGGHFAGSSRPVRSTIVARLGEGGFLAAYSAAMGVFMAAMIAGYLLAPDVPLWVAPTWTRWIVFCVMPFALFLILGAFMQANATMVGRTPSAAGGPVGEDPAAGIMAITRHPMLWGVALFALAHIPVNGDAASALLFGGLAVLCVGGAFHIDVRRAHRSREAESDDGWDRFERVTSNIPFLGLVQRKTHLSFKEIGPWPPLTALAAFLIVLLLHERVIGVSPFPL